MAEMSVWGCQEGETSKNHLRKEQRKHNKTEKFNFEKVNFKILKGIKSNVGNEYKNH